jgi:16S rRNA (guanine527-N7)-methyltransferase
VNVSRETSERLAAFEALVRKWNPAINLVSKASLADLRQRHVVDSMQLFDLAGVSEGHWLDVGTGGGFPGLVVAILAAEAAPGLRVTCIESDGRKAAFLATAVREFGLSAVILAERVEVVPSQEADVVSARALAPLSDLLELTQRHLKPGGIGIFPKGARHAMEVAEARARWRFDLTEWPSRTDPDARILKLGAIERD